MANYYLSGFFLLGVILLACGTALEIEPIASFGVIIIILVILGCCVGIRFREQNKNKKIYPIKKYNANNSKSEIETV